MQWLQLLLWCSLARYGAARRSRRCITAAVLTAGLAVSMASQLYLLWLDDLLSLQTALPLHLCGMMAVLCIPLCWLSFPAGDHLLMLLGLPGALLALFFPAVTSCTHPLLMRMAFLRLHALIAAVAVFLRAQKKPLPQDPRKAFLLGNGFLILVACINDLLGSNYLFLRAAPSGTPLAFLIRPGYSVYIASLELLCMLLMRLLSDLYGRAYFRK